MSDHPPPKGVRQAAGRALRWIDEGRSGKGFTSTGQHRAVQLAAGEAVSDDVIERMRA